MFSGESGGRARNAWATCPPGGDNAAKAALIPNGAGAAIAAPVKGGDPAQAGPAPRGGARVPSACWRGNGPPRLTASWSERTTSRTGTETLPRLLREAAVEDHSQWAEA